MFKEMIKKTKKSIVLKTMVFVFTMIATFLMMPSDDAYAWDSPANYNGRVEQQPASWIPSSWYNPPSAQHAASRYTSNTSHVVIRFVDNNSGGTISTYNLNLWGPANGLTPYGWNPWNVDANSFRLNMSLTHTGGSNLGLRFTNGSNVAQSSIAITGRDADDGMPYVEGFEASINYNIPIGYYASGFNGNGTSLNAYRYQTLNGGTASEAIRQFYYPARSYTYWCQTASGPSTLTDSGFSIAGSMTSVIPNNFGFGAAGKVLTIYLNRVNYTVSYNGNGATGGSTAAQSAVWGTGFNLRPNGFNRTYTVNYNANGGSVSTPSKAVASSFLGWYDRGYIKYNGFDYWWTTFDFPYYINKYSDAKAAYGYNKSAAVYHFYQTVIANVEGSARWSAPTFNLDVYRNNYADLRSAFGNNRLSYLNHYQAYGRGENRDAGSDTSGVSDVYPNGAGVANLSVTNGYTVPLYAKWKYNATTLPTPTKTGYTPKGWYTAASGGTYVGAAGGSYTPKANTTLFAQWTPNTYYVAYHPNKPSGASSDVTGTMAKTTHVYDTASNLRANTFSLTGWTFTGWNTAPDGSGNSHANGRSISTFTATNGGTVNLYAQWTPNTYYIEFDGNGATSGNMAKMTCKYDTNYTLTTNAFAKTGYTFDGWSLVRNGVVSYGDRVAVKNVTDVNNKTITLYAKWTPITYTLRFDPNSDNGIGTVEGSMSSMLLTYDEAINLPLNTYTKTTAGSIEVKDGEKVPRPSVFRGWSFNSADLDPAYLDGALVGNLTTTPNATLTLYAIWDDAPSFIVAEHPDRYFSLEDAKNGIITEAELLSTVVVYDRETNPLERKTSEDVITSGNDIGVTLVDYKATDFTDLTSDASVSTRYKVKDEIGNTAFLVVTVYISVNEPMAEAEIKYTRSISDAYYKDDTGVYKSVEDGGLAENSRWVNDDLYKNILDDVLSTDTYEYRFTFDADELAAIREYVETNGFGNSENPSALRSLFNTFD